MPTPYVAQTSQPTVYRPRMAATLSIPYLGTKEQRAKQERSDEIMTIDLPLLDAEVESNNPNTADSASVTVDWRDSTLDTRLLDDGVLRLYMGNADENGRWNPTPDDCVFIGHVRNPERSLQEGSAGTLRIECVDYTGLFLEAKPFGSKGIPDYSQTLEQAWRRICSQTPGSGVLADNLVCDETIPPDTVLGNAVSERFAALAKVPTHPDTDAWAVWLQCVGMLGAVTFIDQDVCVVTTATDLFSERDPVRFSWGTNLISLIESRQNIDIRGGVAVTSFDPLTGKALEAFYPPIGDPRVHRKLTNARRRKEPPLAVSSERDKRHFFSMWGVTRLEHLELIAKRAYEQLSRQEVSGKLRTPHMFAKTKSGRDFNLLKLKSGDTIQVDFDAGQRQYLSELPSEAARAFYLVERGYAADVALLLARNVEALAKIGSTFYVDSVRKRMSVDENGGDFEIEVSFMNKIEVSEGAVS